MPNTPAAAPAVSSTVGLKNMVIAPVTEDNETSTTYGDLQRVAGAIEANCGIQAIPAIFAACRPQEAEEIQRQMDTGKQNLYPAQHSQQA